MNTSVNIWRYPNPKQTQFWKKMRIGIFMFFFCGNVPNLQAKTWEQTYGKFLNNNKKLAGGWATHCSKNMRQIVSLFYPI